MGKFIDLTGRQFGRLTVVERGPDVEGQLRGGNSIQAKYRRIRVQWYCQCVCGEKVLVQGGNLQAGSSQSCGCLRKEVTAKTRTTHGHTRYRQTTSLYHIWASMLKRCYNPNCKGYKYYGARGIGVCERWQHSFENFVADMGPKPNTGQRMSIDRVNNDGDYEPGNCRWATDLQQAHNKRPQTPRIKR